MSCSVPNPSRTAAVTPPSTLLVFTPDLCPQTSFFPLFAKVVMFWCGRVPAAAALLFCSVALFAEMCSEIQFHLPVSHGSWGEHKERGAVELVLLPPLLLFSCVYISLIPVRTLMFPPLNVTVTVSPAPVTPLTCPWLL